jgi:hypothetical protein
VGALGFAEARETKGKKERTNENALIDVAILNLTRAFSAPVFSVIAFWRTKKGGK